MVVSPTAWYTCSRIEDKRELISITKNICTLDHTTNIVNMTATNAITILHTLKSLTVNLQ